MADRRQTDANRYRENTFAIVPTGRGDVRARVFYEDFPDVSCKCARCRAAAAGAMCSVGQRRAAAGQIHGAPGERVIDRERRTIEMCSRTARATRGCRWQYEVFQFRQLRCGETESVFPRQGPSPGASEMSHSS